MKNLAALLTLLILPSLALVGCATSDKDHSEDQHWEHEEGEKCEKKKKHKHKHEDDEREERMEREVYRDK